MAAAIKAAHRKPRRATQAFDTELERRAVLVDSQLEALLPLLPDAVRLAMLGGPRGAEQVPDRAEQDALVARAIKVRSGAEGERVARLRSFLEVARTFAVLRRRVPPAQADSFLFPMSLALAHELIFTEHTRAVQAGNGPARYRKCTEDIRTRIVIVHSFAT